MRSSDDNPPLAPMPGAQGLGGNDYLDVDLGGGGLDDIDMLAWLDSPASANNAPHAHHLFGEARIHSNTHRSKLERALELIRASELEESPLESEQGLIQLWIPEDMADSHFGPRRLQNVVVGTTTKTGSPERPVSPVASAATMESSSEEEGPNAAAATGTALATLADFGERSKRYRFKIEGGLAEGLPGRVFVSGRPEMTLDVRKYGQENYLRIHEARSCGIKAAVGIPVYRVEGGLRETVAVVEISKVSDKLRMERLSCKLAEAFESVDLLTWGREAPSVKFGNWPFNVHVQRTSAILNTLVEAVCQLSGIAYVATWGKTQLNHFCLPSTAAPPRNLDYLSCDALPCGVQDSDFIKYRQVCSTRSIVEGHGIVGTAWTKNASIWHADISNLLPEINPYSQFGIGNDSVKGAVVAVPITLSRELDETYQDGDTSKYVMEIFITDVCRDVEEQRRLIVDMLSLLLRIGGGRFDIGVLLEYFNPPQGIPSSFLADGTRPIHRVGSLESRGLVHVAEINHREEESGRKRKKSSSTMAATPATTPLAINPSTCQASPLSAKKTGGNSNKKSISLETLHKYFKYNLKEAAKKLNVCPTTLKRVCRQHGIPRWPCRKLKKVNRSMAKLQGVVENCPGVDAAAIGFPDLKAACVFDTSSSEHVSRGAQRVGIHHGGVRRSNPLEEVTSKGKMPVSTAGEVGPSSSHSHPLLSQRPQSALSKELKEAPLGMGNVSHGLHHARAPIQQPVDNLSDPMTAPHASFPPASLPACSPIPIPHLERVNSANLAYASGPHFNSAPLSLATLGQAPRSSGDHVYHQSASCLTPPMLSPRERDVGLQVNPGETLSPGEGVLNALSRRIQDIEDKLLVKKDAGGSAKGDRVLVEINQRLKALEKAYCDDEGAEAGAS